VELSRLSAISVFSDEFETLLTSDRHKKRLSHMEKMLISYAMWGAIVFFTLGALLARQPTKIIALLSLLVLFSSQLGHFDPLTSGSMSADMVFFSAVMIFLSLLAHSIGIGAGLIVEAVTRRAFCFS